MCTYMKLAAVHPTVCIVELIYPTLFSLIVNLNITSNLNRIQKQKAKNREWGEGRNRRKSFFFCLEQSQMVKMVKDSLVLLNYGLGFYF